MHNNEDVEICGIQVKEKKRAKRNILIWKFFLLLPMDSGMPLSNSQTAGRFIIF